MHSRVAKSKAPTSQTLPPSSQVGVGIDDGDVEGEELGRVLGRLDGISLGGLEIVGALVIEVPIRSVFRANDAQAKDSLAWFLSASPLEKYMYDVMRKRLKESQSERREEKNKYKNTKKQTTNHRGIESNDFSPLILLGINSLLRRRIKSRPSRPRSIDFILADN